MPAWVPIGPSSRRRATVETGWSARCHPDHFRFTSFDLFGRSGRVPGRPEPFELFPYFSQYRRILREISQQIGRAIVQDGHSRFSIVRLLTWHGLCKSTRAVRMADSLGGSAVHAGHSFGGAKTRTIRRAVSLRIIEVRPIHGAVFPPRSAIRQESSSRRCRNALQPMPPPRVSFFLPPSFYGLTKPPFTCKTRARPRPPQHSLPAL